MALIFEMLVIWQLGDFVGEIWLNERIDRDLIEFRDEWVNIGMIAHLCEALHWYGYEDALATGGAATIVLEADGAKIAANNFASLDFSI